MPTVVFVFVQLVGVDPVCAASVGNSCTGYIHAKQACADHHWTTEIEFSGISAELGWFTMEVRDGLNRRMSGFFAFDMFGW